MQVFDVYEHPRLGLRAVRQGFSWPAFIAPTVWAAALGLGRVTFLLVLASTLMFDLLDLTSMFVTHPLAMGALFVLAYVGFGVKPGFRAHRWVAEHLRDEGWQRRCRVVAASRRAALQAVREGRATADPGLLAAPL